MMWLTSTLTWRRHSAVLTIFCLISVLMTVVALVEVVQADYDAPYQLVDRTSYTDNNFGFASYYQSNMVLQMSPARAIIWGYGTVGSIVNVSIIQDVYSTRVLSAEGLAAKQGIWKVTTKSYPPGGNYMIQGVQDNHGLLSWILIRDVTFGDVWICSGQSNMELTVGMAFNASDELNSSSAYNTIRVMSVLNVKSDTPRRDFDKIDLPWSRPSASSLGGQPWTYFSAVCWLYGKYLYDELQVPIGLVSLSWGGTPIEAWSSHRALRKCGLDKADADTLKMKELKSKNPRMPPQDNSVLWNGFIHPILNMTIKGVVWYQGEQNSAYHTDKYACAFPAMIRDWRRSWRKATDKQTSPDFPFGFVQIAVAAPGAFNSTFPLIRWYQTAGHGTAPNSNMPNTFMAVALDLPDDASPYGQIHPRDKQDVARRLVLGALNIAYGRKGVEFQGPLPVSAERKDAASIVVAYAKDQQLVVKNRKDFELCCGDRSACNISGSSSWYPSPILARTADTVTIGARACADGTTHVRYAWSLRPCDFKSCSVYNKHGLPAPPFYMQVNSYLHSFL